MKSDFPMSDEREFMARVRERKMLTFKYTKTKYYRESENSIVGDCNELYFRFPGFKSKAVTLSYDDGLIEDRKMVEMLNEYGLKCTFNLNAGIITGKTLKVQFEEFEELYRGHEIATHSFNHPHLCNLDCGGVAYQIIHDRETLEEVVKKPVQGFAYPYGLTTESDEIVSCLGACGIRYARTTLKTHAFGLPRDYLRWHPTCHHDDEKFFELAERFLALDDTEHPWRIVPKLFYLWGHSYEFKDKWDRLEAICKTLGGKEEVFYGTNMEIIDCIDAYRALRRSANGKYVYNPTDRDVYVWTEEYGNVLLEKGKTTVIG